MSSLHPGWWFGAGTAGLTPHLSPETERCCHAHAHDIDGS